MDGQRHHRVRGLENTHFLHSGHSCSVFLFRMVGNFVFLFFYAMKHDDGTIVLCKEGSV